MNSFSRRFKVVLSIFSLMFLSACSSPKLERLPAGSTVLAFGDSLTQGVGTTAENSYPAVLARLTGFKVVNAGISGELTEQGLKRFPGLLEEIKPSLIILLEGGNDILRNKSLSKAKQNLSSMILLARSKNIPVVLVGVPAKALFSRSVPMYEELADAYGLALQNSIISELHKTPSLKSDFVHYNKEGYRQLAVAIFDLLLKEGAI